MVCETPEKFPFQCHDCVPSKFECVFSCVCDFLSDAFYCDKGLCVINKHERRLRELLTVQWNAPWMLASYIAFASLSLIALFKIMINCRACNYTR